MVWVSCISVIGGCRLIVLGHVFGVLRPWLLPGTGLRDVIWLEDICRA